MSKIRRERCPQCGSMDVIKLGTRGGRRRFKCKNCDSMFTYRRKDVSPPVESHGRGLSI